MGSLPTNNTSGLRYQSSQSSSHPVFVGANTKTSRPRISHPTPYSARMDHATRQKYFSLNHLLYHNNPPSPDEEHLLKQSFQYLLKNLADLDLLLEKCVGLDPGENASLQQRRSHFLCLVPIYKGVLSPLRRFPPEILAAIFIMSIESTLADPGIDNLEEAAESADMFKQSRSRSGPYVLIQICSFWRHVALRTPQLWNNIVILSKLNDLGKMGSVNTVSSPAFFFSRANHPPLPSSSNAMALLDHRIKHSGSLPLDVTFQHTFSSPSPGSYAVRNLLEVLLNRILDHAKRWRSARFRIVDENPTLLICLSRLREACFPHLQKVYLSLKCSGRQRLEFLRHVFVRAPQLSSFVFRPLSAPGDYNILSLELPWTQLTTCDSMAPDTALPSLLRRCPRLRRLVLYSHKDQTPWQNPTVIVHDALECLSLFCKPSLAYIERQTLPLVLGHLQLSGLKEFRIESYGQTISNALSFSLCSFFVNSQPRNLQVLCLNYFHLDEVFLEMLRTVAKTCPGLIRLQVGVSRVHSAFLAKSLFALFTPALNRLDKETSLDFPNLEELSLNISYLTGRSQLYAFLTGELFEMVQSRRDLDKRVPGIKAMRKFGLTIPSGVLGGAEDRNRFIRGDVSFKGANLDLERLTSADFRVEVVVESLPF
ncbi:hypothetical protein VKT23_008523 [Stygiomarasmius scandens]|uniref:F-box domain-containing protein n=1 Tax=Marasmiellus scandens TaxID=2682957 RepID=A0ABR1JHR3_9AGAR